MESNNNNSSNSNRIIKVVISFFLLLNISLFVFGYLAIDEKVTTEKNFISVKKQEYFKKEEDIIEKFNILINSKDDISSNLKTMKKKVSLLGNKLNNSLHSVSSSNQDKSFYSDKLNIEKKKNLLLKKKKISLNNKIKIQNKKKVVKRKTRSS